MLICHNCGTPIENKARQCHHCHNFISADNSFSLADSTVFQPLKIEIETQPSVLNQLIVKELIQATSRQSNLKQLANGDDGQAKSKNSSLTLEKPAKDENYFLALPVAESPNSLFDSPEQSQLSPEKGTIADPPEQTDFFAQIPKVIEAVDKKDNVNQLFSAISPEKFSENKPAKPSEPIFNSAENKNSNGTDWFISQPGDTNGHETVNTVTELDEPKIEENVHRRSFSGNPAPQTVAEAKKPTNPLNAVKDPSAMISELKSRFFSGIATGNQNNKTEKNKVFDLKPSWQLYLAAILLIFLLFKGFEAFCAIGGSLFGNLSKVDVSASQNMAGRWQFAQKWNNGSCQGEFVLHQNGDKIFGQGIDQGYGNYKFNGQRTGNHLDLLKQYYVGDSFVGHAIELHGDLDPSSKPLFLNGNFNLEFMQGGKWRGRPVSLTGIWEAEMIQPMVEDNSSNAYMPTISKNDQHPAASMGGLFGNLSKFGSWIAGGIIAAGCFLYYGARALISPDGLLGIWDKQKYVPAQFMKEHKREKAQLSKPIVAGSLPLGQRWEWKFWQKPFFWIPRYLAIPPELRVNSPHVLILGGGEKGKSRLMAHMITHDIESADRAIVLVDSDGDLADLLLRWMSSRPNGAELAKRTIVIDPTSNIPSPSFNPLELPDDHDLQNAASSIVNGFKAIYHEPPGSQNQWSPQTAHILRNCAMLLMANGKTLLDLPTLLQDNDFRDILLEKIEQKRKEKVEYSTLLETWGQYKRLARTEQWINWYEPILNRVGPTLINQRLRPILTQSKGDINLKNIIAEKKILIVKIPKGQLHEDANLLGSLIVTGLKQAAISLCTDYKINDRKAVMYLDEFDHFIEKETLDAITTETKKFQLGFIGATKTLQHLPEDWRNQIEANIGTMCVFALTKKDGDMLGPRMFRVSGRKAKHRTLMNIFNPINTSPQFELISDEEKYNIDRVLAQSERQFYAFRVGAEAGIFRMKSLDFDDIPDNLVDVSLLELMYKNR